MSKLAIIDIGSNSICMNIFQLNEDGSHRLIDEVKESVRLGDEFRNSDSLSEQKMELAISTLDFFIELSNALDVENTICVATEALRKASNREDFLQMAKTRLDLDIRLLSGIEEAYYDYIGAVNSMVLPDCLIMDIGGSSTEIVKVIDNEIVNSVSLPLGSIVVSQKFHLENKISGEMEAIMLSHIQSQFKSLDWIYGVDTLIGIGGSFRNLAKVHQKQENYPLDLVHNYEMKGSDAHQIFAKVAALTAEQRKKITGLSKDRADIFPGAMAEITVLLKLTNISNLRISGSGLREGLLYDWLLKDVKVNHDVFRFSLQNVMNHFQINENHAKNVWSIVQQLYNQLQSVLQIDHNCYQVLKAATMLHDSGISISYYDHHKHAFYVIINSRLFGLSHKELIMTAWIASIHRKNVMKVPIAFRNFLNADEIKTVQQLGVLLQIAESLDRRQNGNIYNVHCTVDKSNVAIRLSAKTHPGLELKNVENAKSNFQKVFHRHLIVEPQ